MREVAFAYKEVSINSGMRMELIGGQLWEIWEILREKKELFFYFYFLVNLKAKKGKIEYMI